MEDGDSDEPGTQDADGVPSRDISIKLTLELPNSSERLENLSARVDTGAHVSCVTIAWIREISKNHKIEFSTIKKAARVRYGSGFVTISDMIDLSIWLPTRMADCVRVNWSFVVLKDRVRAKMLIGMDILDHLGLVRRENGEITIHIPQSDPLALPISSSVDDDIPDNMNFYRIPEVDNISSSVTSDRTQIWRDQIKKVILPDEIDSSFEAQIRAVLNDYMDVFDPLLAPEGAKLPHFIIKLKPDARPVMDKARMLPPNVLKAVEKTFENWKDQGLVEPTEGPWSSPIVVVFKKTGAFATRRPRLDEEVLPEDIRVCTDLRKVNNATVTYPAPTTNIHYMFDRLVGYPYYAKLDLRSAYQQMVLDKSCRNITGTVWPTGYVQHTRLPFGVTNGPTMFQEAMVHAFSEILKDDYLQIFIDDMVIVGKDQPDFIKNLTAVLRRCRELHLRVKADKTLLGFKEIEVLGQLISLDGRRISEESMKAVKNLAKPKNYKDLERLIGYFNWLREYIPSCSSVMEPLTRLTLGDKTFHWGDEQETSFTKLKELLLERVQLASLEPDDTIVLRTDASQIGLGGVVLARKPSGKEKVLGFMSKKFSKAQQNWSTIEQELYAVLYCLTNPLYTNVFKCCRVMVETDHRNLMYLDKLADSNRKLLRWKLILQEYYLNVIHIPGKTNVLSDTLSRAFDDDDDNTDMEIDFIGNSIPVSAEAQTNFSKVHGGIHGHFGTKKTVKMLLSSGLSWPKMKYDVSRLIKLCPICQKAHPVSLPGVPLKTTASDVPFKVLAIDAVGPLPESIDGFKYLLVLECIFTRWVEIIPTKTLEAMECAECLLHAGYLRNFLPVYLRSDNGTQFVNRIIESLNSLMDVTHHRVLPYSPQSNGHVERTNQEVLRHLRCLMMEMNKMYDEWPAIIPLVQFILNNTTHSQTGHSPHVMLFGDVWDTSDRGIMKKVFCLNHESTNLNRSDCSDDSPKEGRRTRGKRIDVKKLLDTRVPRQKTEDYVDILKSRLKTIHDSARAIQEKAIANRIVSHNLDTQEREFHAGEFVLLVTDIKANKLVPDAQGPFKVVRVHSETYTCELESLVNPGVTRAVHFRKLIPFTVDDSRLELIQKLAAQDVEEYEVKEIVGHFYQQQGKRQRLWLRVMWSNGRISDVPAYAMKKDSVINDKAAEYFKANGIKY